MSPRGHRLQAAAIELLQHMTSRASADSNAKDAVKQMAALRAQREGIEREIEAAQQATAAMEVRCVSGLCTIAEAVCATWCGNKRPAELY